MIIQFVYRGERKPGNGGGQWRSLKFSSGGSKMYIPKNFYRTGGSKTYIPKNFYTKTTCTTLLSEKFGGSGAPPGPLNATPLVGVEGYNGWLRWLRRRKRGVGDGDL
ncbi:hypothetical protein Hanom_Chr04g00294661 [Helianthus anomalus]